PDGNELEALDIDCSLGLSSEIEAVAVCLLHSDLNNDHERKVARRLEAEGFDVSVSSDVSPQFREYERTVTTVANAYLRPVCGSYLDALADAGDEVVVMTSAGGLVPLDEGARLPVSLLLSGPAGGVLAGAGAAVDAGYPNAVTFDMGGTSTDVCLVQNGVPEPAGEREVGGFTIRRASLDVHTVGAGGGSIAFLDSGGALQVGPRSAGAVPGPACYGLGGTQPTVTDADLVGGRYPQGVELPGVGVLDVEAARRSLDAAGITANDVISVVDASMEQAVRAVTVARGVDPSTLALVAFGGAGPLHACAVAEALNMAAVVVPARAGVLSALGCLAAPRQHDVVASWPHGVDLAGLDSALDELRREALEALPGAEVETALECRYVGQSHEIRVSCVEDFPAAHEQRNGYSRPGTEIEVVALRATARLAPVVVLSDMAPVQRQGAIGPAVIAEADCTIWVPEGWQGEVHSSGALVITRTNP
ncbi:MAG: hydantoinase/oxoprolinase family protein, partial [Acidimicrobiales bacterium]|nr:hydantoinase/oxoprolinase family protein [Acidimicrobiales bacterium]